MFTREIPIPVAVRTYGPEPDQVLEIFGAGSPIIALIHGGYWRPEYSGEHVRPLAAALARTLDARVVNVEYRRIPGDPDASIDDVTSAIAHLYGQEGSPLLLIGHSAGGHLALLAQHRLPEQVRAVVALAPVSDLALAEELDLDEGAVRAHLGCAAAERRNLDPRWLHSQSETESPPTITLIHGDADIRVPIAMSRAFPAGELIELSGVGHFELIDPGSAEFEVVAEAVRRRLTTPGA